MPPGAPEPPGASAVDAASGARALPRQIAPLQELRGVAALAVAFLHIEQAAGAFVGRPGQSPWPFLRLLPWEAGVDVFFVISGFVMVYASRAMFGSRGAARVFLARRIARVVPLYWLATALTVGIGLVRPGLLNDPLGGSATAVLAAFLFIPWRRPDGFIQPVFRLGWTLNYEMLFYAVFALFLPLPRRFAVPGVIGAVLALAATGWFLAPQNAQLAFWTDPIVAEFAFGVALGAARARGWRLPRSARVALVAIGIGALAGFGADVTEGRALAYGLPAACLVAACAFGSGTERPGRLGRVGAVLGDASYALYLLHPFPMRGLREVWARAGLEGTAGIATYIGVALALSCTLAVVAHVWVERPLLRLARRALGA